MCRKIYFIVLITFVLKTNGLRVGESCIGNGFRGVCKAEKDCPLSVQEKNKRIRPQICSYGEEDVVVCCRMSSGNTRKPTTTSESESEENDYEDTSRPTPTCPPLDSALTAPKTGQKAWDKCIEYQEDLVYPCERSKAIGGDLERGSKCKHSAKSYIVNGVAAEQWEFPHMALLGYKPKSDSDITFGCGGSVISDWYILTAAHCISTRSLGKVSYALLGTLRRSDNYSDDNLYYIQNIVAHPGYAAPKKYHDIALLKTARRIALSAYVVPACLDIGKQSAKQATATGWGAISDAGPNADTLQKVTLDEYSTVDCKASYRTNRNLNVGFDSRTQICYGVKDQAKDTCTGDSGGPLQVHSKHFRCMYVLIGVTSFGYKCGVKGQPAVYTRVQTYVPWIENIVWP